MGMGLSPEYLPNGRVGIPLGILVAALYLFPRESDAPWPYAPLLGLAGVVLFVRLARWEGESADLWSGLAAVAFFLPALVVGVLWGLAGLLALGGAFIARVMTRPPQGRGPVR